MIKSLNDLTRDEQHWLRQLANHNAKMLTTAMAARLKELGLSEQELGGTGISEAGKRLLLQGRRSR
ncbi:hypothetical protein [Ensifer aridi]|uniref:hypothetical protein n=1 Tax=Ensifer aridi TaxID=1708715 RepID=UPI000A1083EF|nr:hypothetical protein [Ensifer aridi]